MTRAAKPPHNRSDEEEVIAQWMLRQRTTVGEEHRQAVGAPLRFGDRHQIDVLRQWETVVTRLDALEQALDDIAALGIIPPMHASAKGLVLRHAS